MSKKKQKTRAIIRQTIKRCKSHSVIMTKSILMNSVLLSINKETIREREYKE